MFNKFLKFIDIRRIKDSRFLILINSTIIFFIFFIGSNTHLMLKESYLLDIKNHNNNFIIKQFFSFNWITVLILYFACGIMTFIILKNKDKNFIGEIKERTKYFITNFFIIILSILFGVLLFFIIKFSIIFFKSNYYGGFPSYKNLLSFVFIQLSFSSLSVASIFLVNSFIKDRYKAILVPLFTLEIPLIIFSFTTILTSTKLFPLKYLGELANKLFVGNIVNAFLYDFRLEFLILPKRILAIISFLILSFIFIILAYNLLKKLNSKKIINEYYFKESKIFYFILISMILSYISTIVLTFIITFIFVSIGFEGIKLLFDFLYIGLIIVYYYIFKYVEKKRNNKLNFEKKEKAKVIFLGE